MNWDDLRVFLAVARRRSYKGAAKLLRVDPTTVGRRLQALELAAGARLFERTPEELTLSAAGAKLFFRAERIEQEVLATQTELGEGDARVAGLLRVTAGDGLLQFVLLPALAELRRQHPELLLELRAETATLDLSRREADVALRFGRPTEPSLVARRVATVEFALFAAERYLQSAGRVRRVAALSEHDFIGFDSGLDAALQVRWLTKLLPKPRYVLRANTTAAQTLAAAEGHGIALLPIYVAKKEPKLRRVLPRLKGPQRELWFVMHERLRRSASVQAFQRYVLSLFADELAGDDERAHRGAPST